MRPLVSILIPAFRAAATLPRAVASVRAQAGFADWEIVVAADDETDYARLLRRVGLGGPAVRIVRTGAVGSGPGPARNVALAAARGRLIALLDADDAWAPGRLRRLVPLARANGAAADDTAVFDDPTRPPVKTAFGPRTGLFPLTGLALLAPRVPVFPVFKRSLAGEGWRAVPFAEDVLFNLELLTRAPGYRILGAPLYRYYKTAGSITHGPDTAATAEAGYAAILRLLDSGRLTLTPALRQAARAEFAFNQRLNRVFARHLAEGRCRNLEDFLARTENGRAPWLVQDLESKGGQAAQR